MNEPSVKTTYLVLKWCPATGVGETASWKIVMTFGDMYSVDHFIRSLPIGSITKVLQSVEVIQE